MTVSSSISKAGPYAGNGVTTTFDYGFLLLDEEHLVVVYLDEFGDETTLVLDEDYSVVGVGDIGGGSVSVVAAPGVGDFVTLVRRPPFEQLIDLQNQGAYFADTVERGFDLVTMLCMRLDQDASRSLRAPLSDPNVIGNLPSASDRSNMYLSFDIDGNPVAAVPANEDGIISAISQVALQSLIGTSASTVEVGTGSKTFATQTGKQWTLGQRLRVANVDGTKIMDGQVTAYAAGSLTINVDYTSGSATSDSWYISITGPRGERGPTGSGTGDLLASNNLSDVASPATAFGNLKQAASATATGVVELATNAETITGTDTVRAVMPAGLAAALADFNGKRFDLQAFTTNGTWVKRAWLPSTSMAFIWGWGPGGGGGSGSGDGAGGGGGGYYEKLIPLSMLGATEAVVCPAGGAVNTNGAAATFGDVWAAGGGGRGRDNNGAGGGGGGSMSAAPSGAGGDLQGTGGGWGGGNSAGTPAGVPTTPYGGAAGGPANNPGFPATNFGFHSWGGGGGSGDGNGSGGYDGGAAIWGGGGGCGDTGGSGHGGVSAKGGNGGDPLTAGSVPGGGGGYAAAGARGEVHVLVFG